MKKIMNYNQTITMRTAEDIIPSLERQLQMMNKIQESIEKLNDSQFFNSFLNQIHTSEASHHFHKFTRSQHKVKMVIYGIGSIKRDEGPRLQLSLAILMKRNLDWIGDIEVFDPIISLTESKVMKELGFRVLSVNEECRRQAVEPILFFMPHCCVRLYNNLLEANWRKDMLNRIVLLGNSFERYQRDHSLGSHLLEDAKHLPVIRRFTKEFKIPVVSDDFCSAFSNLSWHFFRFDPIRTC